MAQQLTFEYTTERGEVVIGRPLSPYVRRGLEAQSETLFPDPDVTPFLGEPDPNALSPEVGQELARQEAASHPDYLKQIQVVRGQRLIWLGETVLRSGVIIDTPEGRDKTLARYRDELTAARAAIPAPVADDWLACVMYCLIASYQDATWIYHAAFQHISEDAQQAAVRYFRRDV